MAKRKKKISKEPKTEERIEEIEELEVEEKKIPKRVRPKRNPLPVAGKPVSFKAWFKGALVREKRLRPHHFSALLMYMRGLGCSDEEAPARYNKGLESYFGK